MGQQTIVQVKVSSIIDDTLKKCARDFGSLKKYSEVRKALIAVMRRELLQILNDAVVASLNYFYENRKRGKMAHSLRSGIQVKGSTFTSLTAIVHGVDYTIIHEGNIKLAPKNKFLAIPLPSACRADGTPILSGPKAWEHVKKTFRVKGEEAFNTYNRNVAVTDINPHLPSEVEYVVYKDENNQLVYLYKLVPYSLFVQGYKNYNDRALKKLGLYNRIVAGIQSAAAGWWNLVQDMYISINDTPIAQLDKYYVGIKINTVIEQYQRTYNKKAIPTKAVPVAYKDILDFAHWTAEIITI